MLKGIPERLVIWRHALRNALIAPFTAIMLHVNWLIGGVVVVEVLFNYPGLGRLLLDAAMRNDITPLMGGTLVLTFVAVASQVLADIGLYFMIREFDSSDRPMLTPRRLARAFAELTASRSAAVGVAIILFWIFVAVAAPLIAPYGPTEMHDCKPAPPRPPSPNPRKRSASGS